ncbi:MAG: hypothetical protein IIC71_09775 [Acidobacteria bacterium]|nr:hypothetical protein [Acidobacteriota bacterium]
MAIVRSRLMPQSFAAWMNGKLVELMLPDAKPPKVAESTGYRLVTSRPVSTAVV